MEVLFRFDKKVDGEYRQDIESLPPTQILSVLPMPPGCFVVTTIDADNNSPESIIGVDQVLFVAQCTFKHLNSPVECYAVADTQMGGLNWSHSELKEVYCYGPYRNTCEIIGEKPLPFVEWYKNHQGGHFDFDIPLEKPQVNAETEEKDLAGRDMRPLQEPQSKVPIVTYL